MGVFLDFGVSRIGAFEHVRIVGMEAVGWCARFSNTKDPKKCVGMCCYHVGVIFVTFTFALIHQDFSPTPRIRFSGKLGMFWKNLSLPQKT